MPEARAPSPTGFPRLPSQAAERQLFGRVEELQSLVATSAARLSFELTEVPLWSTQIALFALARRQGFNRRRRTLSAFAEFARRYAGDGSRVFPDDSICPLDDPGLDAATACLDALDNGELLVLIARTLDFGRTLDWERASKEATATRNLVTAKSQGIFYTPAFIARYLAIRCLESIRSTSVPRVCDPAVGGAIFLVGAAEQLLKKHDPGTVRSSLYGIDTDPVAVEIAATLVEFVCGTWKPGELPDTLNRNYLIGDAFGGPIDVELPGLPGALIWQESFPSIFSQPNPGFDIVLLNPPFGRHKIDSDWLIAKEMKLDKALFRELRAVGKQRAFDLRSSGLFPLSSIGVLDKSRIGLERAMQLTRSGGALGALVPSTIAADTHSFPLRESLLTAWDLKEVNEFPETARLFHDVSQSVSTFVARKGRPTTSISVRSGALSEHDLKGSLTTNWSVDLLRKVSPKLAIPLRTSDPHSVLDRIHRVPPLHSIPELVNARGEVDISAFEDAISDDDEMTPLIRGDQIDCFRTDLPSTKESFVDTREFQRRLAPSPKFRHFKHPRLVGRQCSYLYRHKRLSFAYVEAERAVANSCNYLSANSGEVLFYLLGLLNSSLLNWRFKVTNSNNHVANSELAALPVPSPSDVPAVIFDEICSASKHLSLVDDSGETAHQLDELVFQLYGLNATQAQFISSAESQE